MKVIMLADMKKVGRKGEVVEVSDGYGQNVLLRQGLALPGTPENLKRFAKQAGRAEEKRAFDETLLGKNVESLDGKTVSISAHANEAGTLFQTLHKKQLVEAIKKQFGITISESALSVEDIKKTGTYEVPVSGAGKRARITFRISP